MVEIREATAANRDTIWDIFREVVAARDTYTFDPGMSRQDALGYWFQANTRTYVAESSGRIVGTYILRPNQSGGGSHVANAAFMVAPVARGRGIGRAMAEHCFNERPRIASLAKARFQNRWHFAGCISSSRKRICRCLRYVSLASVAGTSIAANEEWISFLVCVLRSLGRIG